MKNGAPKMRFYGLRDLDKLPQLDRFSHEQKFEMQVVGNVLPFRTNNYVVEQLIDWSNIPDDPMFQLTFMRKGMLEDEHYRLMEGPLRDGSTDEEIRQVANRIRLDLNPHPAGQDALNVPLLDEEPVAGIQHKYSETVLLFPSAGQTCFAYCTFCFRWPQFVGMDGLKFATDESSRFQEYIKRHKEVTDVLITGGDPMIMNVKKLAAYVEPFLTDEFAHIQSIRIGTKALGFWPYRFVTDKDADDILRLFEKVVNSGKRLALMAHINHPVELTTDISQEAVRRILATGAQIRSQAPLLRMVNDSVNAWFRMWREQVRQGIIPYYMFVERDTGANKYFEVPLARALKVYREAIQRVSGLARTVRGPSMSALPGKVMVDGVAEINGEKVFVLNFIQGRKSDWVKRPFFAKYDPNATWLDQLVPAFGEGEFFYETEMREMAALAPTIHRAREARRALAWTH